MLDGQDICQIEERLRETVKDLERRTTAVAEARQVLKFAVNMEKALVAKYTVKHLLAGKSAAASKMLALADPEYKKEFDDLRAVFQRAQKHIEDYSVANTKFEAARSLLSSAKQQLPATFQSQRHIT